jgi:hypothetical protein
MKARGQKRGIGKKPKGGETEIERKESKVEIVYYCNRIM